MFGFPLPLYDSGNSGVKLTNNADSGFPKPNIGETFYSIKDGNWTDITVWQTASGRVGLLPTANDDVYVRHTIQFYLGNSNLSTTINNLFINGTLTGGQFAGCTLNINGNIQCTGTINQNLGIAAFNIGLGGYDNYIANYLTKGETFTYYRVGSQNILNLSYWNLSISNIGQKYLQSNLTILNSLSLNQASGAGDNPVCTLLECNTYNLTVNGSTVLNGVISKSGSGNILFIGNVNLQNNLRAGFDFNGNPNVEFRGGISANAQNNTIFNTGTGTFTFTTNNQTISGNSNNLYFTCQTIIDSGITLTTATTSNAIQFYNTINGASGTSKLLMGTSGIINFATLASVSSMTTGIWDFTTNANTIQYNGNYSATIPSYFTTFSSLTIGGTGTKTLGVNTTVNATLTLSGVASSNLYGILECSTYNLTVNGTTISNAGSILKSGAGNLLFVGALTCGASNYNTLNFSGNPTVELRGGITTSTYGWGAAAGGTFNTGTGQWAFSTNNQLLNMSAAYVHTFSCPILISGAITVTLTTALVNMPYSGYYTFNNTIDGNNALSKFTNQGIMVFGSTAITPMSTLGTFDYTTSTNSYLIYSYNGNLTIPYTTYQGLGIRGTGTKTLGGNTTVQQYLDHNGNTGTFECSTYNLTVTGNTYLGSILSKNAAGNITFIGTLIGNTTANTSNIIFSGNPNVEFRNGLVATGTYGFYPVTFNSGTGTWSFTTNNQNLTILSSNGSKTFAAKILVSGAITLTTSITTSAGSIVFTGIIDGDNVNSKFLQATSSSLNYQNATQPMATGILDTSTNLNTWVYGNSNQDIKGNLSILTKQVHRNLTLNGGGTKTLLGFVSVLNTYTLTPPATVLLNGFTITNP